mmetsp:Transcript_15420/g.45470  ORF Transcript_15420/g.45470 Transcript_15420/m.45470 type:complete len:234 (+) Transcript_15420:398-1099(+)
MCSCWAAWRKARKPAAGARAAGAWTRSWRTCSSSCRCCTSCRPHPSNSSSSRCRCNICSSSCCSSSCGCGSRRRSSKNSCNSCSSWRTPCRKAQALTPDGRISTAVRILPRWCLTLNTSSSSQSCSSSSSRGGTAAARHTTSDSGLAGSSQLHQRSTTCAVLCCDGGHRLCSGPAAGAGSDLRRQAANLLARCGAPCMPGRIAHADKGARSRCRSKYCAWVRGQWAVCASSLG